MSYDLKGSWPLNVESEDDLVDLSELLKNLYSDAFAQDPGEMPLEFFKVLGFVGDVIEHYLAIALRPKPVLALAGAIALYGTRPPTLRRRGLGRWQGSRPPTEPLDPPRPRHAIARRARVPHQRRRPDQYLSFVPARLFQLEEMGRLLQTVYDAKRGHTYNIIGTLATL